nr:gliding motility protein [Pedobacter sp.]
HREQKIALLFEPKLSPLTTEIKNSTPREINQIANANKGNTFYFSSSTAISRGFTDFKKRWGNRVLEDNWRQNVKSSSQTTLQNQTNAPTSNTIMHTNQADAYAKDQIAVQIQAYTALLPLTAEQLTRSNQQIIDAYYEIGGFYQQVLEDQQEATKVYEILLTRFPKNNHLETIYYSLYLGYKAIDKGKSDYYKNLVLINYPSSTYAKTILDPMYSTKQSALDLAINKLYNDIFLLYEKKDYAAVITGVNDANQRFPGNSLQIQYDYLKAIAIGRTENLDSLLTAFQKIITQYPADSLINPLIKDHLTYINANLNTFKTRKIALLDFDETEPKFAAQKAVPVSITNQPPPITPPQAVANTPVPITIPTPAPLSVANTVKSDGLFTTAESTIYYFVVNVGSTEVSVSSSRFGIGQFNRGTYAGSNLKHQLNDLPEDQVIYIGNFDDVNEARAYTEEIKPQLSKIMKVPSNIYKSFYISKENFDKIKDRATLNRYLEFFKTNYEQQ